MKDIDYLMGKVKRLICFVFGHNLRPHNKLVLSLGFMCLDRRLNTTSVQGAVRR